MSISSCPSSQAPSFFPCLSGGNSSFCSSPHYHCIFCGSFSCINQVCGMTSTKFLSFMTGRQLQVSRFAFTEMDEAALNLPAFANTPAHTVEAGTLHRSAASNSFLPIVTPFLWKKWVKLLLEAGTLEKFLNVPKGNSFGWHISIPDSYSLSSSFIPPNHRSALEYYPRQIVSMANVHSSVKNLQVGQ